MSERVLEPAEDARAMRVVVMMPIGPMAVAMPAMIVVVVVMIVRMVMTMLALAMGVIVRVFGRLRHVCPSPG